MSEPRSPVRRSAARVGAPAVDAEPPGGSASGDRPEVPLRLGSDEVGAIRIDAIELVDEGSLLDRPARMEKRGVIESETAWRDIRDLRNQVAHDYVVRDLGRLSNDVYASTPELLAAVARVRAYLERGPRASA